MREFCYIHKSWYQKAKGRKVTPYIVQPLVNSNFKRQMTLKEGLIFVSLMIRTQNRKRHGRRTRYA